MDYEKALDKVYRQEIMECLDNLEINRNDKRIIQNLYWNQSAVVRLDSGLSVRQLPPSRGMCQECFTSPKLVNLYTEAIFRDIGDLRVATLVE